LVTLQSVMKEPDSPGNDVMGCILDGQNLMSYWVVVLCHFWEILDSNLGSETGYPDICYCFPQSLQSDYRSVPQIRHGCYLPHLRFIN